MRPWGNRSERIASIVPTARPIETWPTSRDRVTRAWYGLAAGPFRAGSEPTDGAGGPSAPTPNRLPAGIPGSGCVALLERTPHALGREGRVAEADPGGAPGRVRDRRGDRVERALAAALGAIDADAVAPLGKDA